MSLSLDSKRKVEAESSLPVSSVRVESFWQWGCEGRVCGKSVYCLERPRSVRAGKEQRKDQTNKTKQNMANCAGNLSSS